MYRPFAQTPDIFRQLPTSASFCYSQPSSDGDNSRGPLELEVMGLDPQTFLTSDHCLIRKSASLQSNACQSSQLLSPATLQSTFQSSLVSPSCLTSYPCPGNLEEEHANNDFPSTGILTGEPSGPLVYNFIQVAPNGPLDGNVTSYEFKTPYDMTAPCSDPSWDRLKGSLSAVGDMKSRKSRGLNFFWRSLFPSRKVVSTQSDSDSRRGVRKTHSDVRCLSKSRDKRCSTLMFAISSCLMLLVAVKLLVSSQLSEVRTGDQVEISPHFLQQKDRWWEEAILYEIFPASFRDSDSDGFGDFRGIRQKIPYLKQLGVTGIRLNSIFAALDYPYQYEHVTDFKSVDPHLGGLGEFELLVQALHQAHLTLVLDINPTVTSDQHPWAAQWLTNKSSEFSSFYSVNRENVRITRFFSFLRLLLSFLLFSSLKEGDCHGLYGPILQRHRHIVLHPSIPFTRVTKRGFFHSDQYSLQQMIESKFIRRVLFSSNLLLFSSSSSCSFSL